MAQRPQYQTSSRRAVSSDDPGQNRALASDPQEPHPVGNYFLPGDLEAQIAAFIDDYNHRRHYESINNLTPADVCFGRGHNFLAERDRIKRQTIANRRLQ